MKVGEQDVGPQSQSHLSRLGVGPEAASKQAFISKKALAAQALSFTSGLE
jgi:hypothetical protein